MSSQPGSHGSEHSNPDLYRKGTTVPDEGTAEQSEGRFGRMFAVGERTKNGACLRPHPSPQYDLERLGHKDGPMSRGSNQESTAPAGITFLGQFVDHDITLDVQSKFEKPEINVSLQNARTPNLDLDCVYGGGREASPQLYAGPYLIEGESVGKHGQADASDLLRNPVGRAIIGDPRNDENIIVSQIQSAFIRFHNRCVVEIRAADSEAGDGDLFERARDTTTHYYHRLLLEDFLFHVVGMDMIQDIAQHGRQYYFPNGFWGKKKTPLKPYMPVEFSVAAFRFGHSQIRDEYQLNDAVSTPLFNDRVDTEQQQTLRGFQPLTSDRKVDWERYFQLPGESTSQSAFKIDPFLPKPLLELPIPVVESGVTSLASRNLLRGRTFRLPAGDELAEKMKNDGNYPDNLDVLRISDSANYSEPVKNMLNCLGTEYAMTTIPLWVYVLLEASEFGKGFTPAAVNSDGGDRLGPVGGRIVAEVIMGLLDHYRDMSGKGLDYSPAEVVYGKSGTNNSNEVEIVDTDGFGPRMTTKAFINFAYREPLATQDIVRGVG